MHSRSAMSLVNVAYNSTLTWSNPNLHSLEEQVLIPLFGDHPVELGMRGKEAPKPRPALSNFRSIIVARNALP